MLPHLGGSSTPPNPNPNHHEDMCSSSTPAAASAAAGPANRSFQSAMAPKRPAGQTAQTSMSDGPYYVQHDTTDLPAAAASASANANTTAETKTSEPLLTFTAPLNDTSGHSGTYRPTASSAPATQNIATAQNTGGIHPTTTILPPTQRPADGGADALLDDLERWCRRQFGTALASGSSGSSASVGASALASASAPSSAGAGRKRRRMDSESGSNNLSSQAQHVQMQQQMQQQPQTQPNANLPSHSLTASPSSLQTRKTLARTGTSFSDLLQLFDAHELKEAIATGSVFEDDLAAQSALPGLAPYAADVFGDMGMGLNMGGMGVGGMGGGLMGSGSSLVYDDLLAGIGLGGEEEQQRQVKMPSSIAGSYRGGDSSSGRSSRNDVQQSLPPQEQAATGCAYEMMTSDVALPAETRDELRMAHRVHPSGESTPAQLQQQQQQQQQQQLSYHQPQQLLYQQSQQQQSYQNAAYPPNTTGNINSYQAQTMMPTASVEVTPRSSNVHTNTNVQSNINTYTAFPARYDNPQDYHQPPPPQSLASQHRFLESLEFSTQSERLLREWDRSMGLKACHSKTMLRTSKSRKKLLEKAGNVAALVHMTNGSEGGAVAAAAGGRGMVGSSHPPPQAQYQPNAYGPNAYYNNTNPNPSSLGYASAYTPQEKKEDDSGALGNKSTSHDSFQDQIEKNSQTATMA